MYWMRFVILIIASAVLQLSIVKGLAIGPDLVQPDLMLILLAYFAAHATSPDAVVCSFTIGLMADITGWTLGPLTLAFGLIGLAISYLRQYVMLEGIPQRALLIFLSGFAISSLARGLSAIKGVPVPIPPASHMIFGPLYSAVIGPFLMQPLEWLMRLQDKKYRMGLR
jgi:rod shape-determining protein MreD